MLKKIFTSCLVLILFFAACGYVATSDNTSIDHSLSLQSIECETQIHDESVSIKDIDCSYYEVVMEREIYNNSPSFFLYITDLQSEATYKMTSSVFEKDDIWISYPVLKMDNAEKQTSINKLLKHRIYELVSWIFDLEESVSLEVHYEIKVSSDRLLSVVYTGIGFVQGAARPFHVFQTINVDIMTGIEVMLSDVIYIDESFIELLLSEYAVHINSCIVVQQHLSEIINAHIWFLDWLQDENTVPFYLTKESLGIGISIQHVLGGYAVIEIGYEFL